METVKVKGMSCGHCVAAVSNALKGIDGIKNVDVDLASGVARFQVEKPVDMKIVEEQIKRAGYEVG